MLNRVLRGVFLLIFLTGCNLKSTELPPTATVRNGCIPASGWPTYTVQAGDTLTEIAQSVGISVDELAQGNCLDNRNQLLGIEEVSLGTSTEAILSPREIIKTALLISAINVIVVHNHPTGNPTPSPEDRSVTRVLQDALKVFSMTLLDHLIVGDGNWQSVLNG